MILHIHATLVFWSDTHCAASVLFQDVRDDVRGAQAAGLKAILVQTGTRQRFSI